MVKSSKTNPLNQSKKRTGPIPKRLNLQEWFFLIVLIVFTLLFLRILSVFFIPMLLAVVLAFFFYPQRLRITDSWGWTKRSASSLVVLEVFSLITVPAMIIGFMLSIEAASGYRHFEANILLYQKKILESDIFIFLKEWRFTGDVISEIEGKIRDGQVMQMISKTLTAWIETVAVLTQKAFVNMASVVFQFVIVLYIFYFLLMDGKPLLNKIVHLLPLPKGESQKLFTEIVKISKATVIGTVLIGVLEGTYGAVLFTLFGVQSPVLWGCVMTIFSLLPLVGTNSILLPAALFRMIIGDWISGLVFLVFGCGVVLVSQNVIRPKLVGDQSGIHPAIIVISTIGGIAWLGLVGFLIGPITASLFIALWNQFGSRYYHRPSTR